MIWLEVLELVGEGDSFCGKSVGFFLLVIGNLFGVGNRKDMIKFIFLEDYFGGSLEKGLKVRRD